MQTSQRSVSSSNTHPCVVHRGTLPCLGAGRGVPPTGAVPGMRGRINSGSGSRESVDSCNTWRPARPWSHRAVNEPSQSFTVPLLTVPTSAFTVKNLLRDYAKQGLIQALWNFAKDRWRLTALVVICIFSIFPHTVLLPSTISHLKLKQTTMVKCIDLWWTPLGQANNWIVYIIKQSTKLYLMAASSV